jgi:hypothetical protein
MKYSFAALAFAATALAGKWPASNGTVAYTTEIVTALTTYCPEATTLTHEGKTYTATAVRILPHLPPFSSPESLFTSKHAS